MRFPDLDNKLVIIIGPTGIGKTKLSIDLAQNINGEIISADSRSFYKGMDIGTAKPTHYEKEIVRHHLIDYVEPDKVISLTEFQNLLKKTIIEIRKCGKIPIVVGGTGQYIRSIIECWEPPRLAPNEQLRNVLEDWANEIGAHAFHQKLAIIDPQAAVKIDPNNTRRIIRALEVIFETGSKFSIQKKRTQQLSLIHI